MNTDILSLDIDNIIIPDETQLRGEDLELCLKKLPYGVLETLKNHKCCVASVAGGFPEYYKSLLASVAGAEPALVD